MNFYSKDPSLQYAQDQSLANAGDQARNLTYDHAQQVTGIDLRPLKATESHLIKLGDLAETTKNTLSAKAAQHEATPMLDKIFTSAKNLVTAQANPLSSFFSYEKQGIKSPLNDFNRNMQAAFPDLQPKIASRSMNLPRYNLNLTPPPGGAAVQPLQGQLPLVPGEHGFQLTPPVGQTPPAPAAQYGLPGIGRGGADMNVPPQPELPGPLRPAAGLSERRAIPRSMTMSQSDLEAAIKNRKPITTPFDDTIGARDTMNRDINLPKPPGGGGRTGNSPGSISAEEANRPGTNYLVKRDGSLTAQSKSYAPEETKPGQAHVTLMSNGDYRVNAGDLTPQMEKGLRSGTKAKNRIY